MTLHLALFALLTKPVDPSIERDVTVLLGLGSVTFLVVGVLYELGGDADSTDSL